MKKYLLFVLLVPLFIIYASEKNSSPGKKKVKTPEAEKIVAKDISASILKTRASGGPDTFEYRWTDEIPYNWIDITGIGDSLEADDDWNSGPYALAGEFVFYGDTFDSLAICSNGWLSFTDFSSDDYLPNDSILPDSNNPLNLVAPLFWDLNPEYGGKILYYADTANKRTIIEWFQVPYYSTGGSNTFEVILNSNDNSIIFQYNLAIWWNDSAVVGIQNGDGTVGLQVPTTNLENGYAIRFWQAFHNVSLSSIEVPGNYVIADSTISPVGVVSNIGVNPEGPFDVVCQIDLGLTRVYTDTVTVLNLEVDSTDTITFAPWSNSGEEGLIYNVKIFAALVGDDNPYDDTISLSTNAFKITNRISSIYTPYPPTLDGFIGFEEWRYARKKDVTNILGHEWSAGLSPGEAYLYVMNDSSNLYLAIDGKYDLTADEGDIFCMYFDDNNDHTYPLYPDTTEGVLRLEWYSSGDVLSFAPIDTDSGELASYSCSLLRGINNIPGNMQYEIAIPLNSPLSEELQANVGDTIGIWLSAGDANDDTVYAWWPTTDSLGFDNITEFGEIVLSTEFSGVEDITDEYSFNLYSNAPNPFSDITYITYEIPRRAFVALKIYNALGQLVKVITEGEMEAGIYTSNWDGSNEYGNKVPTGIYFSSLEADGDRTAKKMLLIR